MDSSPEPGKQMLGRNKQLRIVDFLSPKQQ